MKYLTTMQVARASGLTKAGALHRAARLGIVPVRLGQACCWTPEQARKLKGQTKR